MEPCLPQGSLAMRDPERDLEYISGVGQGGSWSGQRKTLGGGRPAQLCEVPGQAGASCPHLMFPTQFPNQAVLSTFQNFAT